MMVKRLISMTAALVAAFALAAAPVSADKDEEEKEPIKFEADGSMLVADAVPALSFDSESYEKYIHLTRDAEKANIEFSQDKDTYYQGVSLSISANTEGVDGYVAMSGQLRDEDGNLKYPDAPEDSSEWTTIGIELQSSDFGLSCFDGCFITFMYRLTAEDETALLDKTVWVYPADDEYDLVGATPATLKVDTTLDDNVSQYRRALISVPEESSATKIVFDIPTFGAIDGDVLYLDNICIELPDSVGENKYVMNLDGYNENAEAREIVDTIKITKKGNTEGIDEEVEKTSDKVNPLTFVIIGVAVVVVGAAVFIIIKKLRNRFY